MSDTEHLKILKSGVENWNDWRIENRGLSVQLSHADFSNADLDNVDLSNADLYGAVFTGASLVGADLTEANLSKSEFSYANLENSKIYKANLSGAYFNNVNLTNAGLGESDLAYITLLEANLLGANLKEANLSGANLSGANLSYADLSNANLHGANLSGANSFEASLFNTNLSNAELEKANFEACILSGTIFGMTNLGASIGLDKITVSHPCIIDFQTLRASKTLTKSLLLKIGLPELFIDYLPDFYSDTLNLYPVFLSHSWSNKPFARKLYEALIAKGVTVFFDEKKMKPGDDIYESISKGISHYDKMILICSKESLSESWWVDRELDRVLSKERELMKERGERINLLIPVTIDDHVFSWKGAKAEDVRRYVIGDFKDWQNESSFEKTLNDLIHALNADRPAIKPPSFL